LNLKNQISKTGFGLKIIGGFLSVDASFVSRLITLNPPEYWGGGDTSILNT